MARGPDRNGLSRREFLRRGAMAGVGAAVASGALDRGLRRAAAGTPRIPTLLVAGEVNAVAHAGSRLIAVGNVRGDHGHEPAVWTHDVGGSAWTLSADGSSFPPGAVLTSATGVGESFVAAGHTHELSRVETIVDDRTGQPVSLPVYGTVPAIFHSGDAITWDQTQRGAPGAALGGLGEVAWTEPVGTLAIGFRSLEAGVGGAYGLVAMTSRDGRAWSAATLPGVTPPRHGAVTLLASLGPSAVLATRGIREVGLYLWSTAAWQAIEAPADRVTYRAAAVTADGFLLAGVDDQARPRIWRRRRGRWREVQDLTGLPEGGVTALARIGASLVAAVVHAGRSIVTEIEE